MYTTYVIGEHEFRHSLEFLGYGYCLWDFGNELKGPY